MTVNEYRKLWISIVDEKIHEECYQAIAEKLKRIRFDQTGEMKPGELSLYAKRHFPSLIGIYRIKKQAGEIPKREKRVRVEHHPVRQKQMVIGKLNQLDLF